MAKGLAWGSAYSMSIVGKLCFPKTFAEWLNVLWGRRCVCYFLYTPSFVFPTILVVSFP